MMCKCSAVGGEDLESKQETGKIGFHENVLTTVPEPCVKSAATYMQQCHVFDASRRLGMVETKTDRCVYSLHERGWDDVG